MMFSSLPMFAALAPETACVHELVEAQTLRTPERRRGRVPERARLVPRVNARANRIAHHLRGLGVGPEVRVGIAMGRSVDAVCAILGVLKSGGAYVPFDPSYPPQRLAFMLEDAAFRVLLTERALLPLFPRPPRPWLPG